VIAAAIGGSVRRIVGRVAASIRSSPGRFFCRL
jgi:hypothetical protein